MAQVKEDVIRMIERLPDDSGLADIMAELYFRLKVECGLKELDEGKGIPQSVARETGKPIPPPRYRPLICQTTGDEDGALSTPVARDKPATKPPRRRGR